MEYSFFPIAMLIAGLVIWRRSRSMFRPIQGNGTRLIRPLLFFLPSLFLILNPKVHGPAWEWLAAIGIGALLSLPLIYTTNYERREDQQIYTVKNMGFFISFLGIIAIRFVLRDFLDGIDQETMSSLFMTLLIAYIVPWRVASYFKFRKVYLSAPKAAA
jgi:membrane protein CcdC involved in cytochrome C biogenesis